MLFLAEQAFVGRNEKRAPLKTPAWEAIRASVWSKNKWGGGGGGGGLPWICHCIHFVTDIACTKIDKMLMEFLSSSIGSTIICVSSFLI